MGPLTQVQGEAVLRRVECPGARWNKESARAVGGSGETRHAQLTIRFALRQARHSFEEKPWEAVVADQSTSLGCHSSDGAGEPISERSPRGGVCVNMMILCWPSLPAVCCRKAGMWAENG